MTLALLLLVASSSSVLADPFGRDAPHGNHLDEAILEGEDDLAGARRALSVAVEEGSRASAAQTWRALRAVSRHDPSVKGLMDQFLPALPLVTGTGSARGLDLSFERALRGTGALTLTSEPGRRRGRLAVTLALKAADGARNADGSSTWILDARATLTPYDPAAPRAEASVQTRVTGTDPMRAAAQGEAACADALARALLVDIARSVFAVDQGSATSLARSVRAASKIRRMAHESRRARAVVDAFPAQLVLEVEGKSEPEAWVGPMRRGLLDVSQDALPLVSEEREYKVVVHVVVSKRSERMADEGKTRGWGLRITASLTNRDGRVLAETSRVGEAEGPTAAEAAARGAAGIAQLTYDALLGEVLTKLERMERRQASR